MKNHTNAVALFVLGAVFMGAQAQDTAEKQTASADKQHDFKNLDERFSYAYGADLARKFKAEGITLDVDILAAALEDVYNGDEKLMSDGEVASTLELYFEIHRKKKEAERAAAGKKNKKEGEKFLAENANKEGVVVTDSGLQYKVLSEGDGDYKPQDEDEVTVHYRGMLVDGTEFDSTYQRDEPFTGKVKKLIPGWTEAVKMMTEGAKWKVYIPADLAYGERGSDPFVGPHATLIFEIELLEIDKQ